MFILYSRFSPFFCFRGVPASRATYCLQSVGGYFSDRDRTFRDAPFCSAFIRSTATSTCTVTPSVNPACDPVYVFTLRHLVAAVNDPVLRSVLQ